MDSVFSITDKLNELDLSNFNTKNVTNMGMMFSGSGVQKLNLSNFNTKMSNLSTEYMFLHADRLKELTLGQQFNFSLNGAGTKLTEVPKNDNYSGKWQNVGDGTLSRPSGENIWNSDEFMTNYDGTKDADTYVWQKNNDQKGADVTVKYVDDFGKTIAPGDIKTGNVGDDYSTDKKKISGYTLKEVQGNPTGKFTDKAQTVTYVYTKNPVKGAAVTAKYVDENGKEIAKSEVQSGNVDDTYMTNKKNISGYIFSKFEGNATGKFTDKEQRVTYIYQLHLIPIHQQNH